MSIYRNHWMNRSLLGRLAEMIASPGEDPAALAPAALRIEGCRIDLPGRTFVHADGREVALTRAEFALLIAFVRNPGRVLSRDQLSQAIAGHGEELYGRSIDMHVGRLRRKIEPDPKSPRFIITVSGAGYKFAAGPRTVEENRESPAAIEPGEQLEAAPERARGPRINLPHSGSERRQLTVLSCELVGSMAPAIDADPEDLAGVVHRFQDACAGAITNMGGSIAAFTGHEVLALFGYPKAYEDDAERAVHAGLDLVAKMEELVWPSGKPLQVRIGIATGLVVVADQAVVGEPSIVAPVCET